MKCPKCGSTELRKSRHGKLSDVVQALFGRNAYRCRSCRVRFHTAESLESPGSASRDGAGPRRQHHKRKRLSRGFRRRLVEVAVFVLMLIVFLVFLRYLTREQAPAAEPESRCMSCGVQT